MLMWRLKIRETREILLFARGKESADAIADAKSRVPNMTRGTTVKFEVLDAVRVELGPPRKKRKKAA